MTINTLLPKPLIILVIFFNLNVLNGQVKTTTESSKMVAPPNPIELLLGNNRLAFQQVSNKSFTEYPKLKFFAITNFATDYTNSETNMDFISNAFLGSSVTKSTALGIGSYMSAKKGFYPALAARWSLARKDYFVVVNPAIYLTEYRNLVCQAIGEYKPKWNNGVYGYFRGQILYNHNTKSAVHERSYFQSRIGMGKGRTQFGIAANEDFYGPDRLLKENYGLFIRYVFY
jgi:hypothetical protein